MRQRWRSWVAGIGLLFGGVPAGLILALSLPLSAQAQGNSGKQNQIDASSLRDSMTP